MNAFAYKLTIINNVTCESAEVAPGVLPAPCPKGGVTHLVNMFYLNNRQDLVVARNKPETTEVGSSIRGVGITSGLYNDPIDNEDRVYDKDDTKRAQLDFHYTPAATNIGQLGTYCNPNISTAITGDSTLTVTGVIRLKRATPQQGMLDRFYIPTEESVAGLKCDLKKN